MPQDTQKAKASLAEEETAIKVYGERQKTARSPKLKRALAHAQREEIHHAVAFRNVLGEKKSPFGYLGHFAQPQVLEAGHNTGVKDTMHEFKRGQLHSGSKSGPVVKSRAQAIAIGLSEARKAKKGKR